VIKLPYSFLKIRPRNVVGSVDIGEDIAQLLQLLYYFLPLSRALQWLAKLHK
jgi:hypothetical protein